MFSTTTSLIYIYVSSRWGERLTYLITNGFGATPLQQDLFYTTGTGKTKTLRALQFRFGVLWSVQEKHDFTTNHVANLWEDDMDVNAFIYFVGSVFILSKSARLAWAPLDRGSVCDFFTSCFNSAPSVLFDFLQTILVTGQNVLEIQQVTNFVMINGHDALFQTRRESGLDDRFGGEQFFCRNTRRRNVTETVN